MVNVLEYHTYVGALKPEYFQDGQSYEQVNGKKVNITIKDGKTFVNGSEIIATVPASNGVIHVIGDVLLPK
ncbi:MAG: fasciclin domain-containing protein [Saprospiraceae bacterium]|nr:fasciclin domain-containing protein [Saprospiraceae bacterium]